MNIELSSFRDPDAVLEFDENFYYRKISENYLPNYLFFKDSGLKDRLIGEGWVLPFEEITDENPKGGFAKQVIRTKKIPFVSYPYEWTFSQFKAAALLTLKINLLALEYGMILKDASMFNIQFIGCKPVHIDLSSFEVYDRNRPWKAYYQFCRHFYGPLFLASKKSDFLPKLLLYFIDGIPLKETISIGRGLSLLHPGPFLHLYLHSFGEGRINKDKRPKTLKSTSLVHLLMHMMDSIEGLPYRKKKTVWDNYNQRNNYVDTGKADKARIIKDFLNDVEGECALDLGCNDGFYSNLLVEKGFYTIAVDIDERAIDKAFNDHFNKNSTNLHPLHINLANPSPSLGWNLTERKSFWSRCHVDVIQALAIIHHLVITYDIDLQKVAELFGRHARFLIIEFIEPEDSQVQILLSGKGHRSLQYNKTIFERSFGIFFNLKSKVVIQGMKRELFFYERKENF